MKLTDKINFNQPKYKLPALIYIPLVLLGFAVYRLFNTEKVEVTPAETTEYYNDKLPAANIKGDGIGDKYTNMLNDFASMKDFTLNEVVLGKFLKLFLNLCFLLRF